MLNLDPVKTQAVADQNKTAFASVDNALADAARLTSAFLAAAHDSGLTASESQRIIRSLHESAAKMIDGRSDMIRATAMLTRCLEHSHIPVTAVGCPVGLEVEKATEVTAHLSLVA